MKTRRLMPPLTGRLLKHLTVPCLVSFHKHFTQTNLIRICLWVDNIANLHCLRETGSVSLCCVFPPVIMSTKLPWAVNVYFHVHLYCISGIHILTGKNWKWSMFSFLWVNGDVSYTLRMACYPVTNYNRSCCNPYVAVCLWYFRRDFVIYWLVCYHWTKHLYLMFLQDRIDPKTGFLFVCLFFLYVE